MNSHSTLNLDHRMKYQLANKKLSLTPVSFISLSSHRCQLIGDVVHDDGNDLLSLSLSLSPPPNPPPPHPFPHPLHSSSFPPSWPVCLRPLLKDVPYWRQVIPSTVSVEAWVQGSCVNGFLHPSFKLFGFSCEYFSVVTSFHQ